MRKTVLLTVLASAACLGALLVLILPASYTAIPPQTPPTEATVLEAYGNQPLHFEPNRGQYDPPVQFVSRGVESSLYLTPAEAVLAWRVQPNEDLGAISSADGSGTTHNAPVHARLEDEREVKQAILRMKYIGANPAPAIVGLDELPGKSNYFIGSRENWRSGIPHMAKVMYEQIYPGIDLVFYGNGRWLEYDFVVAPGVDPSTIRLQFEGAEQIRLDEAGNLLLNVAGEEIVQTAPVVYQGEDDSRRHVESGYTLLADHQVGFRVGEYETERPLIIDPTLIYASYLGGGDMDRGLDIAIDRAGSMHITGDTFSADFPTRGAIQKEKLSGGDVYVSKLDPSGSTLLFSTFIGGGGTDRGYGIAVSDYGEIYVTGVTASGTTFPTQNALQPDPGGSLDAFVLKLNSSGSTLWFSTFLGGDSSDSGYGITVDAAGNPYIVGDTYSSNFPTHNACQPTSGGGYDAFVTKLNSVGLAYLYSTFLGGASLEQGFGIAVDDTGSAYVIGQTYSSDFPTQKPVQASIGGATRDAFISKYDSIGSSHVYSTYLGGNGDDVGLAIDVDSDGGAYVTGYTHSADFPTVAAFQGEYVGSNGDAFVAKMNLAGTALTYSTYLGGSTLDGANGIAVDSAGRAHVAGDTTSNDFPVVGSLQPYSGSGRDVFISVFDVAGSRLTSSTYLGGVGQDYGHAIVLDEVGGIYISGESDGPGFPTKNAFQGTHGGGIEADAIFAKLTMPLDFFITSTPAPAEHVGRVGGR